MFRAALGTLLGSEIEMLADDPATAERELRWGHEVFSTMGEKGTFSTVAGTRRRPTTSTPTHSGDGRSQAFVRGAVTSTTQSSSAAGPSS
jgi:hypothetical protein